MLDFRAPGESSSPEQHSRGDGEERLSSALTRFREGVRQLWPGGSLASSTLDDLEAALLKSDVNLRTVESLLEPLRSDRVSDPESFLRERIRGMFQEAGDTRLVKASDGPTVYFFNGVNGSGKTTSIAKLAHQLLPEHSVLLAAGDTYRAAAIDQLEQWGGTLDVEVIAHEKGGDPSAVVFDAIDAAVSRDVDFLFVDTAGRLHTRGDLMDQLRKMVEVASNRLEGAPHESLLVLDASTGQNGLRQVKTFAEHLPVTGLVLTKLDSTARGGIVLTVADELGVPVKLVGTGEDLEDLVPFGPGVFCDALLAETFSPASSSAG